MNAADKLENARAQGQAQFDSIKEMVEALEGWETAAKNEGWDGPHKDQFGVTYFMADDATTYACASWRELCEAHDIDAERDEEAERTIHEDALEVLVRSDWHAPGAQPEEPGEYQILLCTGGPACRIVGELNEHGEPETATLEVQDWFTPWTAMRPLVAPDNYDSEPTMLAYARCFYFGE